MSCVQMVITAVFQGITQYGSTVYIGIATLPSISVTE